MLKLQIVRGPLDDQLSSAILNGYTSLTSATVTPANFHRWMEQSPEGPALHAILRSPEGAVAGHCCLFPFPMNMGGSRITVAKAEYFFVKENYRKEPVAGHESSVKPAALLLLEQLYRCGRELKWRPYLVSAPPEVAPLHRMAGCRKISISLTECLLTFRPFKAAADTPNLNTKQRVALAGVGALQRMVWALRRKKSIGVHEVPPDAPISSREINSGFSLSSDRDFLAWRYTADEYLRLQAEASPDLGVIAKKGSAHDYVRVCQSSLNPNEGKWQSVIRSLIAAAIEENALGVRWAVYGQGPIEKRLVNLLRKMAFLCVRRERTIYAHSLDAAHLHPEALHVEDSLFCFDS
ncbi:MAG TPA: hypothetical protein VHS29_02975 [Candidatus Acidoferrales bacterium]|jgi:hypothetical protein|nr:hypothetical protein [Candidatus Acidoferrales bacterium]